MASIWWSEENPMAEQWIPERRKNRRRNSDDRRSRMERRAEERRVEVIVLPVGQRCGTDRREGDWRRQVERRECFDRREAA